ncbi:MAG TPA: CPBP family intramembrane glutamic endopeptidase [Thermoanaerobaculia bacterium]|nr:CPBP family intramembrane glutamic endopeptidase [Thermoanaerobaculia bacterium]
MSELLLRSRAVRRRRAPAPTDLLVALAMVLPTLAAWLYFVVLRDSAWSGPVYLAAKLVQFSLPLLAFRLAPEAGLPGPVAGARRADLLAGLGLGALMVAGVLAAWVGLVAGRPVEAEAAARVTATLRVFQVSSPLAYLAMSVGLSVAHAFLEEWYWRGYVYRHLGRRLAAAPALVLASLAFASHHALVVGRYLPEGGFWPLGVLATLAVAVGGGLWCLLYRRSGSLLPPWVAHVLVDAALMALGYRLVFSA